MYCSMKDLDLFFNQEKNQFPIETLLNAEESSARNNRWSFDSKTLMIYNNNYWKGFFPIDQNFNLIKYFGGLWKRFYKEDGVIKGMTHPYEAPSIFAPNLPELDNSHTVLGEVIHLKYTSPEYFLFYDLLKIVDKDAVLGKAFLGVAPSSTPILTFSMSRKYNVDFMTEKDHQTIYEKHSFVPSPDQVMGRWSGRLVSDSSLTPLIQVFTYTMDNLGKLQMEYDFGGLLRGISKVVLTSEELKMYDYTNWHDEVKMVSDTFMVGKWCSPWSNIPLKFGPSFLSVETSSEGSRFCLRFTLKRT